MKPVHFATRTLVLFLSLALAVPNPAWALRPSGLEESNPAVKQQVIQDLVSTVPLVHGRKTAGLEESQRFRRVLSGKTASGQIVQFLTRQWNHGRNPVPLLREWHADQEEWGALSKSQRMEIFRWLVELAKHYRSIPSFSKADLQSLFRDEATRKTSWAGVRTWAVQGMEVLADSPEAKKETLQVIQGLWQETLHWDRGGLGEIRPVAQDQLKRAARYLGTPEALAWFGMVSPVSQDSSPAGLEETSFERIKRIVGSQINQMLRRWSGFGFSVYFDGVKNYNPPRYHLALAKGYGEDWWVHLHLGERWGSDGNGLLFRLIRSSDGTITGLANPMAESLFEQGGIFVALQDLVPEKQLDWLMQSAKSAARKRATILETAIQNNKFQMVLARAITPGSEGLCRLINRRDGRAISGWHDPGLTLYQRLDMPSVLDAGSAVVLEKYLTESDFMRSVGEEIVTRFKPLFEQFRPALNEAQEGRWRPFQQVLEQVARSIERDDLLNLSVAQRIDPGWSQDVRWRRYEMSFYYTVTSMIQRLYGLTGPFVSRQLDPDSSLGQHFRQNIDASLEILGEEVSIRPSVKTIPTPNIGAKLSDEEWIRLLNLQREHWKFFGPLGEYELPVFATFPTGIFAPSPLVTAAELLKAAGAGKNSAIFDPGAGTAHALITAAVVLGARGWGTEIQEGLVEFGLAWINHLVEKHLLTPGQVRLEKGDFSQVVPAGFTHIYTFPASDNFRTVLSKWLTNPRILSGTKFVVLSELESTGLKEAQQLWPLLATNEAWKKMDLVPPRGIIFERQSAGLEEPGLFEKSNASFQEVLQTLRRYQVGYFDVYLDNDRTDPSARFFSNSSNPPLGHDVADMFRIDANRLFGAQKTQTQTYYLDITRLVDHVTFTADGREIWGGVHAKIVANSPATGLEEGRVQKLRTLLKNLESGVRKSAVEALGSMGPVAASAVPDLIPLLNEPPYLRAPAILALERIIPAAVAGRINPKVKALQQSLKDPNVVRRKTAVEDLGKIGPQAAPAVRDLVGLLRDDSSISYIQEAVVSALKRIVTSAGLEEKFQKQLVLRKEVPAATFKWSAHQVWKFFEEDTWGPFRKERFVKNTDLFSRDDDFSLPKYQIPFKEAFLNLAFHGKGGYVEIYRLHRKDREGDGIEFVLKDNGPSIENPNALLESSIKAQAEHAKEHLGFANVAMFPDHVILHSNGIRWEKRAFPDRRFKQGGGSDVLQGEGSRWHLIYEHLPTGMGPGTDAWRDPFPEGNSAGLEEGSPRKRKNIPKSPGLSPKALRAQRREIEVLIGDLKEADYETQRYLMAVGALAEIGQPAVPALMKVLENYPSKPKAEEARQLVGAIRALAAVNSDVPLRVTSIFQKILNNSRERAEVRSEVALAIGLKVPPRKSIPLLVRILLRQDSSDAWEAVELSLAKRVGSQAIPALKRFLRHRQWYVRENAARTLALMGTRALDAIPALQRAENNEKNESALNSIEQALREITAAGLEERVVVEGLSLPPGGLEFHGLTAGLEDGTIIVVPHSLKILATLEPGRNTLVVPKAGLEEVHRIFRHPSIDLQASVVEALGEENIIDLPRTLNEIPAFWKEWNLKVGDVVVVDLPEAEVGHWLPLLQLPEGVAVLNLPHTQAAGLNLSDWAAMVNAAIWKGGILPRIQSVVQSGLQEAVVLDMGV